tara:strand:+ start:1400 stop:1693 length:294 start_codon:yes stop_codon:yes gene_type:complete
MGNDVFNSQSPMGMYFNSNAQGLLQNFLINSLLGNPLGPDEYYENFTGNLGYENSGYGIDVGWNKPNPLNTPGDMFGGGTTFPNDDIRITGKIPLDF